ncbi:MAG: hypothetical protein LBG76_10485 [Treponema sp.]|jgi:hypothetical protein|nr:hypothetical protein [Treponema sp.]
MNNKKTTAGILSLLLVFVLFFTACPAGTETDGGTEGGDGFISLPSDPALCSVAPEGSFPATETEALQLFVNAMDTNNVANYQRLQYVLADVFNRAKSKAQQDQGISNPWSDNTIKSYNLSVSVPSTTINLPDVQPNGYTWTGAVTVNGSSNESWSSNLSYADYNSKWNKRWNEENQKYATDAAVGDWVTSSNSNKRTYKIDNFVNMGRTYKYAGTITRDYSYNSSTKIERIDTVDSVKLATTSQSPSSNTTKTAFSLTISGDGKGAKFVVSVASSNSGSSRYASSSSNELSCSDLKVYNGANELKFTIPYDTNYRSDSYKAFDIIRYFFNN